VDCGEVLREESEESEDSKDSAENIFCFRTEERLFL
jgi:hypothetical protein